MIAIVAYILVIIFYIVIALLAVPYTYIKAVYLGIKAMSFKVYWNIMWQWCYKAAWGLDQAGSPLLAHLGNDLCIKPHGARMGSPDKTLSYYFGRNKLDGTLYLFGLFWAYLIDLVALFFGDIDHTTKAANAEQFNK